MFTCMISLRGSIFDYYGTLKNELPLTGILDLQVINKTILGRKKERFVSYQLGSVQIAEAAMPSWIKENDKICIMQQGIYVQDNSGISLYPYK